VVGIERRLVENEDPPRLGYIGAILLGGVTSVKLVEIRECGSRRLGAVAPVEGCLQSVRLRAAIDGMADCAAAAVPLSSPAPDGAPLRGCGA
jgi:hypothetical protein